jgi:hypothetical protein
VNDHYRAPSIQSVNALQRNNHKKFSGLIFG